MGYWRRLPPERTIHDWRTVKCLRNNVRDDRSQWYKVVIDTKALGANGDTKASLREWFRKNIRTQYGTIFSRKNSDQAALYLTSESAYFFILLRWNTIIVSTYKYKYSSFSEEIK